MATAQAQNLIPDIIQRFNDSYVHNKNTRTFARTINIHCVSYGRRNGNVLSFHVSFHIFVYFCLKLTVNFEFVFGLLFKVFIVGCAVLCSGVVCHTCKKLYAHFRCFLLALLRWKSDGREKKKTEATEGRRKKQLSLVKDLICYFNTFDAVRRRILNSEWKKRWKDMRTQQIFCVSAFVLCISKMKPTKRQKWRKKKGI